MSSDRHPDSFGTRATLRVDDREHTIHRLDALEGVDLDRLPYSIRILLENVLRNERGRSVRDRDVEALLRWEPSSEATDEIAFTPARVLLQDFTGVPAVVDLAAMRDVMGELGGDPGSIEPRAPADLVIDHSIIAESPGSRGRSAATRRSSSTVTASDTSCSAGGSRRSSSCARVHLPGERSSGARPRRGGVLSPARGWR